MRIIFRLMWAAGKNLPPRKIFKAASAGGLFFDYLQRIKNFTACEVRGAFAPREIKGPGASVWLCDRSRGARPLSSEHLASALIQIQNSGEKELHIAIGGPDGFREEDDVRCKIDLIWSFGPLTFPHELAAVVAGEQIYRAFTILHRLPYHCGH